MRLLQSLPLACAFLRSALLGAMLIALPGVRVATAQAPARDTRDAGRAVVASDTMRLRPGDVVRLQVWREPLYNGDFAVDENGYVALPMIGRRKVTEEPWGTLREAFIAQLRTGLNTDGINVVPLRRIYVLGAVLKPGIYMLEPSVGVEGAVALAGGANPDGSLDRLRIIRDGRPLVRNLSITKDLSAYALASGDQVYVDRRSWVDRNSALLLSSFISFAGVIAVLISAN
jgi:polysaccharide export outer membrane protein